MILNNWTPFEPGFIVFDEVNFISVDTRDFHVLCVTDEIYNLTSGPMCAYENFMHRSNEFKRLHSTSAESLPFLIQFLFDKTGGEGDWRHLTYKKSGRWLKYIWFIRINETEFAVCDSERNFIDPTKLKDILDFDNEYSQASKSENDCASN